MSLLKVIFGKTGDATYQAPRIDAGTHTLQTIDYAHHEIHAGSHFEVVDVVDLSLNNVRDIRITTPNTTKWAHFLCVLTVESETEVYLYEDVTIVTAGSAITPINSDRNSATTATVTVDYIDNTSVANANADTTVSGYIEHCIVGTGKESGSANRENEIILDQNKIYCLRMIANTAGFVNYKLTWYEHTNRTP